MNEQKTKHPNVIFIYGLAGADQAYKPLRYWRMEPGEVTINNIREEANLLKVSVPAIESVYAIDNQSSLYWDYMRAIKGGIEACVIFRDILQRCGIRVV